MFQELKPFNIEVIEIVTGFVQSNILHHGLVAPDASLYLPIKSTIEAIKYQGIRMVCHQTRMLDQLSTN